MNKWHKQADQTQPRQHRPGGGLNIIPISIITITTIIVSIIIIIIIIIIAVIIITN